MPARIWTPWACKISFDRTRDPLIMSLMELSITSFLWRQLAPPHCELISYLPIYLPIYLPTYLSTYLRQLAPPHYKLISYLARCVFFTCIYILPDWEANLKPCSSTEYRSTKNVVFKVFLKLVGQAVYGTIKGTTYIKIFVQLVGSWWAELS